MYVPGVNFVDTHCFTITASSVMEGVLGTEETLCVTQSSKVC